MKVYNYIIGIIINLGLITLNLYNLTLNDNYWFKGLAIFGILASIAAMYSLSYAIRKRIKYNKLLTIQIIGDCFCQEEFGAKHSLRCPYHPLFKTDYIQQQKQ